MRLRPFVTALALAGLAAAGAAAPPARADGDPASDVLVSASVFTPYAPPVSRAALERLIAAIDAAGRAGYAVKVAIIATAQDMGTVSSLYGRPAQYAHFLSGEDAFAVSAPILVVMRRGVGLAARGRPLSTRAIGALGAGPGSDGLAALATRAVLRLSAAHGHPVPRRFLAGGKPDAGGGGTGPLVGAIGLAGLAALGSAGGLLLRARRHQGSAGRFAGR
jgi:hypothetical protein